MKRTIKAIVVAICVAALALCCCGCQKTEKTTSVGQGSQTVTFSNCMHAAITQIAIKSYSESSYSSSATYDVDVALDGKVELNYKKADASTVDVVQKIQVDQDGNVVDASKTKNTANNANQESTEIDTYLYTVSYQEVLYDIKLKLSDGQEYEMHKVALDDIAKGSNIILMEEDGYAYFKYTPSDGLSSVSGLADQKAYAAGEASEAENAAEQTAEAQQAALAIIAEQLANPWSTYYDEDETDETGENAANSSGSVVKKVSDNSANSSNSESSANNSSSGSGN